MRDELLAAIAKRMNALDTIPVRWDRCIRRDGELTVYGWIDRDDGRADFLVLRFMFGTTTGLDGEPVEWLTKPGYTTSSARHEQEIQIALYGYLSDETKPCERIEDVFGALVNNRIELPK